jgi:DEAD/DEAH box helicase domain-containing protein
MDARRFLERLQHDRSWKGQLVHVEEIPTQQARHASPDPLLPAKIAEMLAKQNISELYVHQREALELARARRDFVVVTGTASGKTLCYNLPIMETLLEDPQATALYLFPTKALSQDQLRGLLRSLDLMEMAPIAGTYDGDTPPDRRRKLRDDGQLIFTNPDMLHAGILPNHGRWARFFSRLKYVVIDEIHTYRGVFGSHVGGVLKRLQRICAHYESDPIYLSSSATIANPEELATELTGRKMSLIDDDGAPRGPKWFVLWNPPLIDDAGIERRSPLTEAQYLMTELLEERIPTIAFTRTRAATELLYRFVQDRLSPSLARRIRGYRGGYLPEERREIERQLFEGELLGVVSTNALELGIDIGALEACILVGYPGTIASTWQRAGRAGRGTEPALTILVGQNTPVDQYLMGHSKYFFERSPEHAIVDPLNPHVAIGHLQCAARELPIDDEAERDLFGEFTPAMLELLSDEKQVVLRKGRWHYSKTSYPAAQVNLRNIDDVTYTITHMSEDGPKTLGTLEELSAFTQAHTHAIYLHDGETWFVDRLDVEQKIVYVTSQKLDYCTTAITEPNIDLESTDREEQWRISTIGTGNVTVSLNVVMFKKIKFDSRDSIGYEALDLPTKTLDTTALWIAPPKSSMKLCRDWDRVPAEGLKGISNVLSDVVPLYVMGDTSDIGGVVDSSNLGRPGIFIYDKYPGGIGYSERAYEWIEQIMTSALELIETCPCPDGCPSCVGASLPESAAGGPDDRETLPDKDTALILLHDMLQREPYEPKPKEPRRKQPAIAKKTAPPPVKPLPPGMEVKIRKRLRGMKRK